MNKDEKEKLRRKVSDFARHVNHSKRVMFEKEPYIKEVAIYHFAIKLLTLQKEELKKKIEGKIIKEKIMLDNPKDTVRDATEEAGYNHALYDIISELNHQ